MEAVRIIKKKIAITNDLLSKISWACSFANISPEIIEGNLRIIEKTNIAYVEPHRLVIKDKLFLFFNDFSLKSMNFPFLLKKLNNHVVIYYVKFYYALSLAVS